MTFTTLKHTHTHTHLKERERERERETTSLVYKQSYAMNQAKGNLLKEGSLTRLQRQTEQVSATAKDQDWEHSLSPSIPLLPFLYAGSARRLRAGRDGDDRG